MFSQLLVGSLLICATIIIEVLFIGGAIICLTRAGKWLIAGRKILKLMVSLTLVILWLLVALSVAVWIWAGAFLVLDQFKDVESALYFSVVSFTTLGYGDVIIGKEWRLLSGMIAANGLILFSLNTAFLIEFIVRLRGAQEAAE